MNNYIFNKERLLAINKIIFSNFCSNNSQFGTKHLEILECCVESIEEGNRILDKEVCNKALELIRTDPKEYFKNFVVVMPNNGITKNEYITCEKYWIQIFKEDCLIKNEKSVGELFKEFIFQSKYDKYESITLIRNFWLLYIGNNYQPIEFSGVKDLEDRVKNELEEEILEFRKLEELYERLSKIIKLNDSDIDFKEVYLINNQLKGIELNSGLKDLAFDLARRLIIRNLLILDDEDKHVLKGIESFDYSNNDGVFKIGRDKMFFEIKFSKASNEYIHLYNDPESIESIAIAKRVANINKIKDASVFNSSSRARTLGIGEIAVLKNIYGYYAAIKIIAIKDDTREDDNDEVVFEYCIQPDKTPDFSSLS